MEIFFTWIIASFVVGIIGGNRKIGFWTTFFISLILSPLIGLIFVLVSKDSDEVQKNSITDEIEKSQKLRNNNSISEYEFIRLKNKIIDSTNSEDYHYKISENEKSYPNYVKPNLDDKKSSFYTNPKVVVNTIFTVILLTLGIYIYRVNSIDEQEQFITPAIKQFVPNTSDTPKVTNNDEVSTLKNFTYEDITRYAIATIMQQPISIIKAFKKGDLYYVSYVRKSDSQKFEYKVKINGNQIVWAGIEKGQRWRDSEYDEKISFAEKEDKLNIITTYSDGSEGIEEFKKGD
jgi:hypothetical protein